MIGRRAAAAALGVVAVGLSGCGSEDPSRPGSPRTPRTPLSEAPFPYASAAEDVGLSSDAVWLFKERLYSRVVARHVVGAEILVLASGRIVLHQAMGWADRDELRPLERNSIYRLASMTKPLIGTAVLMLAERGALELEAPAGRYLEAFARGTSAGITIQQLLTHRSGFVQGGEPPGYRDQPSLLEAVRLAGERGPTFRPGDRFIYSGLNSDALGAVVSEVSGTPVETFVEERILGPLRMSDTHTTFSPEASWAARVPASYRSWGRRSWERAWNPSRPHPHPWFSPAGDLLGSAFDYALFLRAWMGGDDGAARWLAPETVARALADPTPPRERWYGMHWEIFAPPSEPGGLPVFGHRGATGTLGMAIPARDAIVIYLTNSSENEVVDEVIDAAMELFGS